MTNLRWRRREMDVAWVLLVGLTLAMFLLDHEPLRRSGLVVMLLGMAVLKSVLIGAFFMGLGRASRPALALLTASFVTLGGMLTMLLI
ncbi:MAG: cytochrome C oxidase subunit IV family protein [Polyangiaceae bacterium]|jgi:heme/copper-type cytochrome/quinol oxidase subunit 4|nr:cytochrome C oxidase subunit IV family protein [Polyangiaceae bacterium]